MAEKKILSIHVYMIDIKTKNRFIPIKHEYFKSTRQRLGKKILESKEINIMNIWCSEICGFVFAKIYSARQHNSQILPQVESSTLSKRILLLPDCFVTVILITLYFLDSNGISSPGCTFGA